jgi:arsenate reductase-like glutaredoxin family protein
MATVQEKAMCVLRFFETKSVMTQRRYRAQYGKYPPSDNAIRRWLKQFQETSNVLHRKEREDRALPRKNLIESRKRFLAGSPQKSTRRASLNLGIPQTTVRRVAHNSLHLHAYWSFNEPQAYINNLNN